MKNKFVCVHTTRDWIRYASIIIMSPVDVNENASRIDRKTKSSSSWSWLTYNMCKWYAVLQALLHSAASHLHLKSVFEVQKITKSFALNNHNNRCHHRQLHHRHHNRYQYNFITNSRHTNDISRSERDRSYWQFVIFPFLILFKIICFTKEMGLTWLLAL